jgi:hypothetical protein
MNMPDDRYRPKENRTMHTNHRLPIWARLGAALSLILFIVAMVLALFGLSATTTNAINYKLGSARLCQVPI